MDKSKKPGGRARWFWPLAWAATIAFASSQSHVPAPNVSNADKYAHFLAYGLLGTLLVRTPSAARRPWLAVVLASFYGVTDEFHQSFVPGRSVDVLDWAADTLGAAIAVGVYQFWPAYRRAMECRIGTSPTARETSSDMVANKHV